ncbi:MAG: DNA cytosine methyltransferase [Sporomusaceae bacterium]|nr:DNA cytosine methyltransferase [Sporomusaceae bacterium]
MNYKVAHFFCGIGAGALGFQRAKAEYRGLVGQFETLVGIDCDPLACEDFENLTGAPAVQMDFFSRDDYIAFHGKEPPEDWQEVTPWDLYRAAGDYPDVIFLSPPCKGFSGLLPSKSAASEKYQALNRLVVRSMELTMQAFEENLPSCILIENVPRITSRGAKLIKKVESVLGKYGYVFDHQTHDCGEIGGLGQRRKRFLLIARNEKKIPAFIYKPLIRDLKSIGDVIGPIPLPDTGNMGPLHRMPKLQWKTWVRLALIPAGGDWRDLQDINPEQYRIEHVPRKSSFGMMQWDEPAGVVTGNMKQGGSSPAAIPDPRVSFNSGTYRSIYRISKWGEAGSTVTGAHRPNNGAGCISDPRLNSCEGKHPAVYRVVRFEETGPCVTGTRFGSGAPAISDPRTTISGYSNKMKVCNWDKEATTVTGIADIQSGAQSITDPRIEHKEGYFHHSYGVTLWEQPSGTVTGSKAPSSGAKAIADPRFNCKMYPDSYGVLDWEKESPPIRAMARVMCSPSSIADPRFSCSVRNGTMGVQNWNETGKTVTGSGDVYSGTAAIADPRIPEDSEAGVWMIIAEDGTWHRPLTTLELAALQSLPLTMPDGSPLKLAGRSDSRWREAIGNAVPPEASKAMAEQILPSLMASSLGEWYMSSNGIWVIQEGDDDFDRLDRGRDA